MQVPLPDYKHDAELFQRDFGDLRREMFSRLEYLVDHPIQMTVGKEARHNYRRAWYPRRAG